MVSAALRAVGNIVTGDDIQTQVILNCQALPCLLYLLSSSKENIRKEACWTISNITAGNKSQIQVLCVAPVAPLRRCCLLPAPLGRAAVDTTQWLWSGESGDNVSRGFGHCLLLTCGKLMETF